jgi:dihydroorotase
MRRVIKNVRIVDEALDIRGAVVIEDGFIRDVLPGEGLWGHLRSAAWVMDGRAYTPEPVLLPALVDLHAHFRDPGHPEKETLESASLAAAAGGYGTVVCMANTNPVIDTPEKAAALRDRSGALGLIDLWPAVSLTGGMAGETLSGITAIPSGKRGKAPLLLSEDGRDVAEDSLFLAAFAEARRLGLPVSCHCDAGGAEAAAAKRAGLGREVWSRIEENNGTRRAIALGKQAGCHVHIAHVSTAEAAAMIREAKAEGNPGQAVPGFTLTCEATPHHLTLTEEDARALGAETYGRVNPPLRTEADRQALIEAVLDGLVDALATDHAPHTREDKAGGAPGFTGLETAFAVCFTQLVRGNGDTGGIPSTPGDGRDRPGQNRAISLSRLSALMSAAPARILGLTDRGRILPGRRADLIIVDTESPRQVVPREFRSRGKNSPFEGLTLYGRILKTIHRGRIVY